MRTIIFSFVFLWLFPVCSAPNLGMIDGADALKDGDLHITSEGKKGLVVVFLSAKCPCSDSHIGELKRLANDYSDFKFVAVNSNSDETKEQSQEYFNRVKLEFPVVKDKNLEIADRYKAFKTPHAFVISADGQVVYQGGVSSSRQLATAERKFLREALSNLHEGKPIATPESRTLGCVITRGEKNVW